MKKPFSSRIPLLSQTVHVFALNPDSSEHSMNPFSVLTADAETLAGREGAMGLQPIEQRGTTRRPRTKAKDFRCAMTDITNQVYSQLGFCLINLTGKV